MARESARPSRGEAAHTREGRDAQRWVCYRCGNDFGRRREPLGESVCLACAGDLAARAAEVPPLSLAQEFGIDYVALLRSDDAPQAALRTALHSLRRAL